MEGNGIYRKSLIPYTDLCLMTLCNGGIISPSSLSWWGAWLNESENKVVVAPKIWFADLELNKATSDLCPEEWIRIRNIS